MLYVYINLSGLYDSLWIHNVYIVSKYRYIAMKEQTSPLLTYICSISAQGIDKSTGKAKTFSIFAGDYGGFSSNILEHMPPSKESGKYLMTFDPVKVTLTIRSLEKQL